MTYSQNRSDEIAHNINANLPESYRNALIAEDRRMAADVLTKRGLNNRKILIVGGGGYIGSVVSDHLLSCDYQVRCLDKLVYRNQMAVLPMMLRPGYEFICGDLCNFGQLEAALEGVTDVILLAGLVGDPVTKAFPEAAERVNDEGHNAMLRLMTGKGLNKLVFKY